MAMKAYDYTSYPVNKAGVMVVQSYTVTRNAAKCGDIPIWINSGTINSGTDGINSGTDKFGDRRDVPPFPGWDMLAGDRS